MMAERNWEIPEYIDVFRDDGNWKGEVNMVAWYGSEPKVDVRSWNGEHSRCSKGITMTIEDARLLGEILVRL